VRAFYIHFNLCCANLRMCSISRVVDDPLTIYLFVYLFVAHTLGGPNEALGAAVLAGAVTALIGLFCVGSVQGMWVPSFLSKIFI
jgi:hypothetical protein